MSKGNDNTKSMANLLLAANPSLSRGMHRTTGPRMQESYILKGLDDIRGAPPSQYNDNEPVEEEVPIRRFFNPGAEPTPGFDQIPIYGELERVEGGETIKTYKMPIWADRCQYFIKTDGRPMKGQANLWIGPNRQVHTLQMDCDDGDKTPVHATIKFKKLAPTLKISTGKSYEFPLSVSVVVPSPERSSQLEDNFMKVWRHATDGDQKQKSQGRNIAGGQGSIRYWQIPPGVKSVQVLGWSGDVGKKSFKMDFEVLQGPNERKQSYFFQCGGSTQPMHAIIQTPGDGCVIRLKNKKFIEDGLCEFVVMPYEVVDDGYDGYKAVPGPGFSGSTGEPIPELRG
jgi:hypothetical protein